MSKPHSPINAHRGAKEGGDSQDLNAEYNLVYDGKAWQTDLHHTVPVQTAGSRTMSSATAATSATVGGGGGAAHRPQPRTQSEIHVKEHGQKHPLSHRVMQQAMPDSNNNAITPGSSSPSSTAPSSSLQAAPPLPPKQGSRREVRVETDRQLPGRELEDVEAGNEEEVDDEGSNKDNKSRHTKKITIAVSERRMMGEDESYHKTITGEEAELRLAQHGGHCYLTRYSRMRDCYVLSVYEFRKHLKPETDHFEIVVEANGKHRIKGKSTSFDTIQLLLKHYRQNRINPAFKSIGTAYTEERYIEDQPAERTCTLL